MGIIYLVNFFVSFTDIIVEAKGYINLRNKWFILRIMMNRLKRNFIKTRGTMPRILLRYIRNTFTKTIGETLYQPVMTTRATEILYNFML